MRGKKRERCEGEGEEKEAKMEVVEEEAVEEEVGLERQRHLACLWHYVSAQGLEQEGDTDGAMEAYQNSLDIGEGEEEQKDDEYSHSLCGYRHIQGQLQEPPLPFILSEAHHNLGLLQIALALTDRGKGDAQLGEDDSGSDSGGSEGESGEEDGEEEEDEDAFESALWNFRASLALWPDNIGAKLGLANYKRDQGEVEAALLLYKEAASLPVYSSSRGPDGDGLKTEQQGEGKAEQEGGEGEGGEGESWEDSWLVQPRNRGVATATYIAGLLLEMLGRHKEAALFLKPFGYKHRLAGGVWEIANSGIPAPVPTATTCAAPAPVTMWRDAIPPSLLRVLLRGFNPGAPYWQEVGYENRGYFSFWYDLERKSTNAVEELIRHLLPRVEAQCGEKIVGAEWWTHTRLTGGRNLGHQLHFDTEEVTLEKKGSIVHPRVSSVVYLTGGTGAAAPTLVLEQTPDQGLAERGWMAHPEDGAFMIFPGDLLHGVLPCPLPAAPAVGDTAATTTTEEQGEDGAQRKTLSAGAHRLTLMVGWWTMDVASVGERKRYGPCGPVPECSETVSWPATLSVTAAEAAADEKEEGDKGKGKAEAGQVDEQSDSTGAGLVSFVSPVWEDLSVGQGSEQPARPNAQVQTDTPPPGSGISGQKKVVSGQGGGVSGQGGAGAEEGPGEMAVPKGLDQRFFIRSPGIFRQLLFVGAGDGDGGC